MTLASPSRSASPARTRVRGNTRRATSAVSSVGLVLMLLAPGMPSAEAPYYALIVHGGNTTRASYDKGMLRVEFRHSKHSAGGPVNYDEQVPSGQAAWPDRPLSPQEPSVLFQQMPVAEAMKVIHQLNERGYWKFYCRNTGKGYLEVLKSNGVSASYTF